MASYIKPQESYSYILSLKDGIDKVVDNIYKVKIFIDIFFPKMAAPKAIEDLELREEIQ